MQYIIHVLVRSCYSYYYDVPIILWNYCISSFSWKFELYLLPKWLYTDFYYKILTNWPHNILWNTTIFMKWSNLSSGLDIQISLMLKIITHTYPGTHNKILVLLDTKLIKLVHNFVGGPWRSTLKFYCDNNIFNDAVMII